MIFLEKAFSDGFRPPFSAIWPHFQPNGIAVNWVWLFPLLLCTRNQKSDRYGDSDYWEKGFWGLHPDGGVLYASQAWMHGRRTSSRSNSSTRLTFAQVFSWTAARSIRYGNRANCHSRSSSTGCTTRQRTWKLLLTDWRRSPLRVRKQK